MQRKWIKGTLVIGGTLFFLLVLAAVIIPFVVDVDKYRPQIVEMANQNINGRLELGKLKLSLWGRVLVQVDGVSLSDAKGNKIVAVKDAFFHLPFSSLLSGAPILTFKMQHPQLAIVRDAAGKLNAMSLMKASAAAVAEKPKEEGAAGVTSSSVALPALVTKARLGIDLRDAEILFTDQATGLKNVVKDLNFVVRDISMTRPMALEIWADLKTTLGNTFQLQGPFRVEGKVKPQFEGTQFKVAQAELKFQGGDLVISVPGIFQKAKGIPANLETHLTVTSREVKLESFSAHFHNAELRASGQILNLTPATPDQKPNPQVQMDVSSTPILLASWVPLIPPLAGYELDGSVHFQSRFMGPVDQLRYQMLLDVKDLTAKAPNLKAKPVIQGKIEIETDQIKNMLFTLKAPGNDLEIKGTLASFGAPKGNFVVQSTLLDLDQLMNFPPPAKTTETASAGSGTGGGSSTTEEDYDALLNPLRKNAMLAKTSIATQVHLKQIKARGISIDDVQVKGSLQNLAFILDQFSMKLFDGTIGASAKMDLKPTRPSYSFSSKVQNFDLKKAVASQLELFKNTLYGKVSLDATGNGVSFNPPLAKKNLELRGKLNIKNAVFTTIDVGRMTTEALNESLTKISEKVSILKGKKLDKVPNVASEYEEVSSTFSLKGGEFSSPDFYAKAISHKGIDLKGDTRLNILDYGLQAKWQVIDTYNVTHARDLSPTVEGTTVPHILAKGSDPVSFPVTVGCKLTAPCYQYGEVPGHLTQIALHNVGDAAKGRAKAEVQKQADKVLEKIIPKAPEPAKKALDSIRKKFSF